MTRHAGALMVLVLSACGGSADLVDAGALAGADATLAGLDAASGEADAGPLDAALASGADVGLAADAATAGPDATTPGLDAAAAGPDAGPAFPACAPAFAGCSDYTDATASGAARDITFPGAGNVYTPRCLKITAGQSIAFNGNFSFHPLQQACGPSEAIGSRSTGTSGSFTLSDPGDYGYYCTHHGAQDGSGMAGSIRVVP